MLTRGDGHLPDADLVVRVPGEQGLAVSGPGHGQALGLDWGLVAGAAGHLGLQLLDHVLAFQVPDLDDGAGGGAQPVPGKRMLKSNEKFCFSKCDEIFREIVQHTSFKQGLEQAFFGRFSRDGP